VIDDPPTFHYTIRDMKLIKTLLPAFLLASCATTTPSTTRSPEQRFQRADKNGDGSVSRAEATQQIITDAFALYDSNRDGFVSEEEFVASGGTSTNFHKINKSGNGKITLQEAQASREVFDVFVVSFDEADANKDGKVTWQEYQSHLTARDAAVR
jgi:Ca2+-binding EF-hand superfamily protein